MVTRSEGYARARGKEHACLVVVRDCIEQVMGLSTDTIMDPELNHRHGDLSLVGTAECKGQPIDPERYDQNFVEVFEDVTSGGRDRHTYGLRRLARILDLEIGQLAAARYLDCRGPERSTRAVGWISHVSVSIEAIDGSDLTIYANPDPQRTFVYFYTRAFLIDAIRDQIVKHRLRRGTGNANEDTFGVFVPVSPARWQRMDGTWTFAGAGDAAAVEKIVSKIRNALEGPGR